MSFTGKGNLMKQSRKYIWSLLVICLLLSLVACEKAREEEAGAQETLGLETGGQEGKGLSSQAQEAIKKMEEGEIGPDYIRTQEGYFDETTLHLFYERKLDGGGTDAYDAYDVFFDLENLKVERIIKKGQDNKPAQEGQEAISEEEARALANDFLAKYKRGPVDQVKITTAKEDLRFLEFLEGNYDPPYKEPGPLHKVYLFSNKEVEIAIDMYTGQVVAGDLFEGAPE